MGYKIIFEKTAAEEFSSLDNSVKRQIQKYLDKLAERENPRTLGEPLEKNLANYWKYRVGDYRLVAEIKDTEIVVVILVVSHRRDVYKKAAKRLG